MPSRHERTFFERRRSWSEIKHQLLGYYLVPWSAKVGSTHPCIYVVDPFAGAGYYGRPPDQVEGSPVIAVRRAEAYETAHPGERMEVICVEHNDRHFASLVEAVGGSPAKPLLLHGDFADNVAAISARMGQAPALILLDPIGLTAISPDTCRELLTRRGPTDLFIIVHFAVAFRIGGMLTDRLEPRADLSRALALTEAMDRFFASHEWRAIARAKERPVDDRSRELVQVYARHALQGRYPYVSAYAVRDHVEGRTKYWIVHASGHPAGFRLVNDALVHVDRDLARRSYPVPQGDYLPGLAPADPVQLRIADVERSVCARVQQLLTERGGSLPFGRIEALLSKEFFGQVKMGDYARLVKALASDRKIARQNQRASAALGRDERITLVAPSQ